MIKKVEGMFENREKEVSLGKEKEMFRELMNGKIGELLVYLAERIPDFTLTKALKILFLIDERATEETGVPVTWLDYEAWQYGPVASEIYHEFRGNSPPLIKGEVQSLESYVRLDSLAGSPFDTIVISPVKEFDDSEFSDYEMELVDEVVSGFGSWSAKQLVAYTHRPGSKWERTIQNEGLKDAFEMGLRTSHYSVNLAPCQNDEEKKMAYIAAREAMEMREVFYETNRKRNQDTC